MCCGTKRLTEIHCPTDCAYLAVARAHPAAAVARQQQRDLRRLLECMRDFNQRQSELFLMLHTFLARYQPPELQPLVDEDVADAAAAMAATFETAARGVIYDHRPPSRSAERLVAAIKPLLAEAGQGGGAAFERDAAVVLRRLDEAVRDTRSLEPSNRRAYLEGLGRMVTTMRDQPDASAVPAAARLIVP